MTSRTNELKPGFRRTNRGFQEQEREIVVPEQRGKTFAKEIEIHGQKWSPTWLPSMRILTQNKNSKWRLLI
jgi:hypothetical protein